MTAPTRPLTIGWHTGDRAALRPLFELAEDSPTELDGYLDRGRVLLARVGGEPVGHLQLVEAEPGAAAGLENAELKNAELKNMAVREDQQGRGIGRRLVRAARALLTAEGAPTLAAATATADVGNLRFYQRQGFRMRRVERDAFTPATGYPADTDVD